MKFETKGKAQRHGFEAQKLMPEGWKIVAWNNLGWNVALIQEKIAIFPVNEEGWGCLCGIYDMNPHQAGVEIIGGPWTTGTIHNHPWEAALHEAKAMQEFVQEHVNAFRQISEACQGLDSEEENADQTDTN